MTEDQIFEESQEFSEENTESSYFLLVTYDILEDNRLTDFQKLLYAAITGLCRKKGYCYARNEYFEKLFGKKTDTISKGISKLVELGYLKRKIVYKKEYDLETDRWVQTKEIAGRQLYPIINSTVEEEDEENHNRGIMKNHNRGYNEKSLSIYNNKSIKDNITFTKVNGEAETSPIIEDKENNINNTLSDYLVDMNNTQETAPAAKPKRKAAGIGLLMEITEERFSKEKYPELNNKLNTYIHSYIGCRKLPTEEKWNKMLDDLTNYSTISISGAEGGKFLYKTALMIVEKAINGTGNGAPFTEFDNPNIQKEPEFNLNQEFKSF